MAQFNKGTTYTDVSPGKTVTSTNLNAHVDGATALNGLVLDQVEKAATVAADCVLLGDSTLPASGIPKKVQLTNLVPETIRQGVQQYVASDTGSANAYAIALSPAATAYTAGMVVRFKAGNANTTASTINVNALGTKNIFTRAGAALAANDILANQIVTLVYDGTQFQLVTALSAAEVTATHLIEAARQALHQYAAGVQTATVYAVTLAPAAAAYTAGMVVRFKADTANVGAVDVNVNGLGAKNIFKSNASSELAANDILANQIVTLVYDGTQFQFQGQPRSWEFAGSGAVPAGSAATTVAHGLGAKPTKFQVTVMNNTAASEAGYAQNDEVNALSFMDNALATGAFALSADATNIIIARNANASAVKVNLKTGGTPATITAANWLLKVYASL